MSPNSMFDIVKYCHDKNCEKVEYLKVSSSGNNPKISKAMRYSQYVNNVRSGTVVTQYGGALVQPITRPITQANNPGGTLNVFPNMAMRIDYGRLSISTGKTKFSPQTTLWYR